MSLSNVVNRVNFVMGINSVVEVIHLAFHIVFL